jgi:DNA-binding beta-propeller fold protein YncE
MTHPRASHYICFCLLAGLLLPLAASAQGYSFVRLWGSRGTGERQFHDPIAVALDPAGNVLVLDQELDRIQKFTPEGALLATWGSEGAGPGQFDYPTGIAVDAAGNVFVADQENCRIQKLTAAGVFLAQWGTAGTGDGQFMYKQNLGGGLSGVAVDRAGHVYTTDTLLHRVQKFTSDGQFLAKWGTEGSEPGQFDGPHGIAVDREGQVYVADTYNYRIQKFSAAGEFLAQWGTRGTARGQLSGPAGLALDAAGNLYVTDGNALDFIEGETDTLLSRVVKFTGAGAFVAQWSQQGEDPGDLNLPTGIAVDAAGRVYVADTNNHRLVVFAPD